MSEENNQITQYPKGDILDNYQNVNSVQKFEYLKGTYVFRYPFTFTAIKWGVALGSFFALHTYFKKKDVANSVFWFFGGSIITGMPIWGFFMMKYTFYSVGLRKFEEEQQASLKEQMLIKEFYAKKLQLSVYEDDEALSKSILKAHRKTIERYAFMDELLSEENMKQLEKLIDS